jgi:hypothetical protein
MRQAASLEIWRTKAVVEGHALESVHSLAFRPLPPNRVTSAVHGYNRGSVLQFAAAQGPHLPVIYGHQCFDRNMSGTPPGTWFFRVLQTNPFDCQTGAAADSTAGNRATSETQRHRSAPPHRAHCSPRRSHRGLG